MRSDRIKFLVMDVDGTLTDGKIYFGPGGEVFKAFHVRDGYAIRHILGGLGITPVIITGRKSDIVACRAQELKIRLVYQGVTDKTAVLKEILAEASEKDDCRYSLGNCAYIGDDLPDLPCMLEIKAAGGLLACPGDAVREVRDISDFVSREKGGEGAVREFIEFLASDNE